MLNDLWQPGPSLSCWLNTAWLLLCYAAVVWGENGECCIFAHYLRACGARARIPDRKSRVWCVVHVDTGTGGLAHKTKMDKICKTHVLNVSRAESEESGLLLYVR